MRIAHVRERHAPAGRALAAGRGASTAADGARSLDRPRAGPSAGRRRPTRAGARQRPASAAADDARRPPRARPAGRGAARPRRGLRRRATTTTRRSSTRRTSPSVRPSSARPRSATSTPSRATSGRCGSAAAARSRRRGTGCRSSTSATRRRSAGRTIRSGRRRRRGARLRARGRGPRSTRPAVDLTPSGAEEAIGGYTIFDDWSARDLQREETTVRLGPAKGKDFASSFGPWLVTPDELADARVGDRLRPGDDRRGERDRDQPRPLVRRAVLVRRRCSPAPRPTPGCARAT